MTAVASLYRSSVGKKTVMAVTGIVMYGFLVLHMIGNLKAFTGEEHFDAYADFIRTAGQPALGNTQLLWTLRLILLGSLVAHVVAAYQLSMMSRAARPIRYEQPAVVQADPAARTMRWTGVFLGLFIIYHILHMTTGTLHNDFEEAAVYRNTVEAFSIWWVTLVYLASMVALAMHLYHGMWSMFQTLGQNSPRANGSVRLFATASAIVLFVGFSALPLAVLFGGVD